MSSEMKYKTDGRQMMEDTLRDTKANRHKGKRAGHHQGKPMIGDKFIGRIDTCRGTNDERKLKSTDIRRAGHHHLEKGGHLSRED